MTTLDPGIDPAAFQALKDRINITDTLYRYASCIDVRDNAGVRSVFADDLWAQYGNAEPIIGGDAVAAWIDAQTTTAIWQHHMLSVYHVDIDGDHAKALIYHTSRQLTHDDPETMLLITARYHNELRREPSGWKITKLVFEILWAERGKDTTGFLTDIGGYGPNPLP